MLRISFFVMGPTHSESKGSGAALIDFARLAIDRPGALRVNGTFVSFTICSSH